MMTCCWLFDPRLWSGGALSMLVLLGAACAGKPASSARGAAVPADLHIILGTAGMTPGGMQGWSIRADGTVMAWAGKAPEADVRATGTLPAGQVADLWAAIRDAGFFDVEEQAMATRVAFITVTADGRSRRVAWTRPLGQPLPDSPLERLYARLREAATTALDPSTGP